jgi:hypothetical protein
MESVSCSKGLAVVKNALMNLSIRLNDVFVQKYKSIPLVA